MLVPVSPLDRRQPLGRFGRLMSVSWFSLKLAEIIWVCYFANSPLLRPYVRVSTPVTSITPGTSVRFPVATGVGQQSTAAA